MEVELLFGLLSHGPLGNLENAWTELLFIKLHHERGEALHDGVLHRLAHCDALLVGLVGKREALFEEGEELLAVLLDELGRQILEDWDEKLSEVPIGLLIKSGCADTLGNDLMVRVESRVNRQLLVSLRLETNRIEDDRDLAAFVGHVATGRFRGGYSCDQLL